jgi:hypothetical protein
MIMIAVASIIALALIIWFVVFVVKKKEKGERIGEREQ